MASQFNRIINISIFLNIIVLFTLPQINNVHFDPSPSFWGQITFAWASISLFLIILFSSKKISLPFITIPLAIFGAYLYLQQFFVSIPFIGLSYTTAIEMLICIFIGISINTIVNNYGLRSFMLYISIAMLIGALLQSGIGFIQYNNLFKYFGGFIFYDPSHPTSDIFGHFGQRNHYCHFLSWASFAVIYLYYNKVINKYFLLTILSWFMFSITIAASRSVFIYFGLANLIALLYWLTKRDKAASKVLILTILASILLVTFEYIYPIIQSNLHSSQISSGLNRLAGSEGSETGRRLVEWKKAFITFTQNIVFGAGWFGYAKNSVFLYKLFPNTPLNSGLFINCHNFILQLLAETGIIGSIIAILGILYAIIRITAKASVENIFICFMLATTLAHSMVEYPLWYFYFLGPFIMFLSIDKPIAIFNRKTVIIISTIPIITISYIMAINSIVFDKIVDYTDAPDDIESFQDQAYKLQDIANNNTLSSYFAVFTLDNYINVDTSYTNRTFSTAQQIRYETLFTYFQPYPNSLIKLAKLEWDYGDKNEAKRLTTIAITAYPVYKNSLINSLHSKKYKVLYNIARNYKLGQNNTL